MVFSSIRRGYNSWIWFKILELDIVIADKYFEYLDGPIKRVASKDSPVPYNWFLEDDVLVQVSDISNAIKELLEY